MIFNRAYYGKTVLVTGHTGLKGSWLVLWLQRLGAKVVGIALPPVASPSHWALLDLDIPSFYVDIRDAQALRQKIEEINPDIVFHLAAQALVRPSYKSPLDSWATNVMGTAHVLEACRYASRLAAIVVITSDKCYENKEWTWGYREIDPLGGHDPYSASKAGAELVAASYRNAFFHRADSPLIVTARAGNVVGGGDWSEDRLIPDLVRSLEAGVPLKIRSPNATRPWQHVLDCLSGYLLLGQKLLDGERSFTGAWNFGPDKEGNRRVIDVLEAAQQYWPKLTWMLEQGAQPAVHEARLLYLDSSKSRDLLQWQPVWCFDACIKATVEWYQAWLEAGSVSSDAQLSAYLGLAQKIGVSWMRYAHTTREHLIENI